MDVTATDDVAGSRQLASQAEIWLTHINPIYPYKG